MPKRPSNEELKEMMLRHARLQMEYKGEFLGIREMRKHVAWYTTGLPNSARLRGEINAVESYEELENLLEERLLVQHEIQKNIDIKAAFMYNVEIVRID